MITFDPTITFGAGTVAGALAMKIIDNWLAKSRGDRDRSLKAFNDAAEAFREAFKPEFISSQSSQAIGGSYFYVLKEAFNRHESAVIAFKGHLSKKALIGFERAWEEYCYPEGDPESAPYPLVDYISDDIDHIDYEKRKLASSKIASLLKFANHK